MHLCLNIKQNDKEIKNMGDNIYTWIILIKNTLNKVFRKKEKHIVKDVIGKSLCIEERFIISSNLKGAKK